MSAFVFKCLPSQYRFLRSKAPLSAYIGGLGSGKTFAGGMRFLQRALDPRHRNVVGIIGANSYKQLHDATLATLFDQLETVGIGYEWKRQAGELWISGRKKPVLCRSLERPDLLRGIVFVGFSWIDETAHTRREAFDQIIARLRTRGADNALDITTTPDGFNWLYEEFIEKPELNPKLAERRFMVQAATYENHHLPEEYIETLEASYDELLARQELLGEFINVFSGRVYRTFDRNRCQSEDEALAPSPRYPLDLTFDFNVDPIVMGVHQYRSRGSGPDEIVTCEYIELRNGDTPEVCQEFIRRFPQWKAGLRIFGDATGKTRGATTGKSDYDVIREMLGARFSLDFHVPTDNPSVIDSVNAVNALYRERRGSVPERVIGIIRKGCAVPLVRDFERLGFKPGTRIIDKSDPMLSHASDGFRYYVHRVAPIGRYTGPPVRTVTAAWARR